MSEIKKKEYKVLSVTYKVNADISEEMKAQRSLTRRHSFLNKADFVLGEYCKNNYAITGLETTGEVDVDLYVTSFDEKSFNDFLDDIDKIMSVINYHSPFDATLHVKFKVIDTDGSVEEIEAINKTTEFTYKNFSQFKRKISLELMRVLMDEEDDYTSDFEDDYDIMDSLIDDDDDEIELGSESMPNFKNPIIRPEDYDAIKSVLDKTGYRQGSAGLKQDKLKVFVDCDFKKSPYIDDYTEEELYKYFSDGLQSEHFPKKIQKILIAELIQYKKTGKCTPIIFYGSKGCGKTEACTRIAKMIGLPYSKIDAPGAAASRGLRGTSSTFSNADDGEIAESMIRHRCVNPILVIDEIDKAQKATGNGCDLNSELLSVCDGNRCINDMFLDITIDTSHCIILMTANEIDNISPFLRDRCRLIHYPELEYDRVEAIVINHSKKFFDECNYAERIDYNLSIISNGIKQLWNNGYRSFRPFIQAVECIQRNAYMDALDKGRRVKMSSKHLAEALEDYGPVVPKTQQKRRIGFDVER